MGSRELGVRNYFSLIFRLVSVASRREVEPHLSLFPIPHSYGLSSITRSIKPYSLASWADMKKSRSMSFSIFAMV